MIIKIVEDGKKGDLFYIRLNNGRIFYSDLLRSRFEREMYTYYSTSVYEIDKEVPDIYQKHFRGSMGSIDKLTNLKVSEEKRKFMFQNLPIRKGDVVLELGSYYGFSALRLSELVGEKGLVITVEASKKNFQILEKNINVNKVNNIIPINKGIWSSKGKLTLYDAGNKRKSLIKGFVKSSSKEKVDVDTIDNILEETHIKNIDVVASDLNGSEYKALKGMPKLLSQSKLRLFINGFTTNGCLKIKKFLEKRGYEVYIGVAFRVYAFKLGHKD